MNINEEYRINVLSTLLPAKYLNSPEIKIKENSNRRRLADNS